MTHNDYEFQDDILFPIFEFFLDNGIEVKDNGKLIPFPDKLFEMPESEKGKKNTRSALAKFMDKMVAGSNV